MRRREGWAGLSSRFFANLKNFGEFHHSPDDTPVYAGAGGARRRAMRWPFRRAVVCCEGLYTELRWERKGGDGTCLQRVAMPEPMTIAAASIGGISWLCHSAVTTFGTAALGGAIGNPTDRLVAATLRDMKTRFAGLRGSPANHDVARAVRIAQIQALESVIRNYREVGRPEWVTDEVSRPEIFFHRSLDFCTRTIGRYAPTAKVKPCLEITKELEKAIDGILAEPESDRPAGKRLAETAKLAEDAVLGELLDTARTAGAGACRRWRTRRQSAT
jgi:hypothetical protein